MRMTVNRANIRQFVNDMITKTLRRSERNQTAAPSMTDLNICSAIIQVCVQSDYKNLMMGYDQDERLSWFVRDVLFPLAHIIQI